MVTTKLNLSMTEPQVRQIYAKQGDTGRVLDISLDQTPEDGTLRILRPDGVEVTSEAVTGGEVESGGTFESLTEADVTELTVGIEPVQDLNGYDKPWVGGAGKNLLPPFSSFTENGITATVANDGTITLNGTATANVNKQVTVNAPAGDYCLSLNNDVAVGTSASTTVYFYAVDGGGSWVMNPLCNVRNAFGRGTSANGITVVRMIINSGVTLNNFVIKPQLELGSTATSYSPYSNICPITGHDEVEVTQTGKNLLNPSEWESGLLNTSIGSDINSFVSSSRYAHSGICEVGQAKTVTIKTLDLAKINYGAVVAYVDDKVVWTNAISFTASTTSKTWTLTSYEKLRINLGAPSGVTADASYVEAQVEQGSTAASYEPYQGSTYTTSLGQTVYGGTLDMVSGVLTVDKAMVDLGSLTWVKDSSGNRFYSLLSGAKPPSSASVAFNGVSSAYKTVDFNTFYSDLSLDGIMALSVSANMSVRNLALNNLNATDFATAITGQQLVYELATPQTYQPTPQQIKTLVGTNNVWASSGQIVNIKFTYGGLLSELPSDATSIVGKCYCDVEQNGVSSMPFTLNVKKNERES